MLVRPSFIRYGMVKKAVQNQRTIIRNCDQLNRLLELNLYIAVLANTHPDFTTEL